MTTTYCHPKCRNASCLPWEKCSCGCNGAGHPQDFVSKRRGVYVELPGARCGPRWTAIPFSGTDLGVPAIAFSLGVHAIETTFHAAVGEGICNLMSRSGSQAGDPVRFDLKAGPGKPTNLPSRQNASRQLLALASKLDAVPSKRRSKPELDVCNFLFPSGKPGSAVIRVLGLTMCGVLQDSDHAQPVTESAYPMLLPLLLNHLVNEPVAAVRGLSAFNNDLLTLENLARESIDSITPPLPVHAATDHNRCKMMDRIVSVLAKPGKLTSRTFAKIGPPVTAAAIAEGVSSVDGDAEGRFAQELVDNAVASAISFDGKGLLMLVRLVGVLTCFDLHADPVIVEGMLRPLAARVPSSTSREFVAAVIRG